MKRIVKILPLILIYLIVCAKSCDNNEQSTLEFERYKATNVKDSITSVFESNTLNQNELKAFETMARLKLNDLADYLKIMNDSSAEKTFKEKAREMATALFIPGKKVPEYPPGTVFDSIRVCRKLQAVSDSLYSGQLGFSVKLSPSYQVKRNITDAGTRIVDIFALKQKKVFGRDTLKIWNVLLGDIR